MYKKILFFAALLIGIITAYGQTVSIQVDINANRKVVSPWIYGRNNSIGATDPNFVLDSKDLDRYRDAGVTMFRENGGNNATKYNFRRKLSSHPDWYNNVYRNDWDQKMSAIAKNFPNAQAMFSFNLIGKAAKTNAFNFNDWSYNNSQWWEGVNQNLAGNGELNPTGSKAKKEGDPNLYLEDWPADSVVAILDHWFGPKGQGYNPKQVQYWGMDNEPEIWNGTHDDLMPTQISAEEMIQRYVTLALKAKAKDPNIKLMGPVAANEWQWYNYGNGINYNGRKYNWSEYFIMRLAEIQKTSGVRLLDVFDVHFYPGTQKTDEITQLHRVFFDKNYVFPEANGVKNISGNWDNTQNKEYFFARVNDWLDQYFGKNHGIKLGMTETGINGENASVTAVWYANMLGTFMQNEVEVFTPWSWKNGMWETLHLFTKFNKNISVASTSSLPEQVAAYSSINANNDTLTIVLVNRAETTSHLTKIDVDNFVISTNNTSLYTLKSLPNTETFFSSQKNNLQKSPVSVVNNSLVVELAPLSVNSIQIVGKAGQVAKILATEPGLESPVKVSPNPSTDKAVVTWENSFQVLELISPDGQKIEEQILNSLQQEASLYLPKTKGIYLIRLLGKGGNVIKKVVRE